MAVTYDFSIKDEYKNAIILPVLIDLFFLGILELTSKLNDYDNHNYKIHLTTVDYINFKKLTDTEGIVFYEIIKDHLYFGTTEVCLVDSVKKDTIEIVHKPTSCRMLITDVQRKLTELMLV